MEATGLLTCPNQLDSVQIRPVDQGLGSICTIVKALDSFPIKGDGHQSVNRDLQARYKPRGTYHPDSLVWSTNELCTWPRGICSWRPVWQRFSLGFAWDVCWQPRMKHADCCTPYERESCSHSLSQLNICIGVSFMDKIYGYMHDRCIM